jgi:hypothetical protein
VRWEALFDDLEAQLAAADAQELAAEIADRSRREVARLRLGDRARASLGVAVTVGLGAAGTVAGRLRRVGPDWWLLDADRASELLIPAAAALWVSGLPAAAADPDAVSVVEGRLGLAHVLRVIARDRSPLTVVLRDGASVAGTIDRVGADFVDVAEHPPGESRRASAVRSARTIPFGGIGLLRRS